MSGEEGKTTPIGLTPLSDLLQEPMRRGISHSYLAEHVVIKREESIEQEHKDHRVEKILMEPYEFVTEIKGKEVRNLLIDAFQKWLDVPSNVLDEIKDIIGKLHNSSLLIDDIEDRSTMRRGRPVAHNIYGEASCINCANYVYFKAMDQCRALDNRAALDTFLDEMLNLHRGQGLDIYWRDNHRCPTLEEYEAMVLDKTGGLFRLSVNLMRAFSKNQTDYTKLTNLLALFFQIRDDYLNLSSDEYMKLKDFCEDLTEGKFSFPIIHCILIRPHDHRLLSILRKRTEDVNVKKHAVEWIKDCGSFDFTLARLREVKVEIESEVTALGGNPYLSKIMDRLCAGVLNEDQQMKNKDNPASSSSSSSSSSAPSSSSTTTEEGATV